jgi:hypothetical protein
MSRREAPEHILAADLMTLFGRIATGMSFPFLSDRFAPAISTVEGVYQNRPLFPSETVRSLRDGQMSEFRRRASAPSAALTAAPTTAEVESAQPTLLPFAIPRCSSLQYGKMLAAR